MRSRPQGLKVEEKLVDIRAMECFGRLFVFIVDFEVERLLAVLGGGRKGPERRGLVLARILLGLDLCKKLENAALYLIGRLLLYF